jgi:septation ring formation regulator EzrA
MTLIKEIEDTQAKQLKDILDSVRELARTYRRLENTTFKLVSQTRIVGENVHTTAVFAAKNRLKPSEAFESMRDDFGSLSDDLNDVMHEHEEISDKLKEIAETAKDAKEANDVVVQRSKEMQQQAKEMGILAIPGAALIGCTFGVAMEATERVDNKILKIPAGIAGAVGGFALGTVATIGCPLFAIWAGRCALLGLRFSIAFGDVSVQVLQVEQSISSTSKRLATINGILKQLENKVFKNQKTVSKSCINLQFSHIKNTCKKLTEACEHYVDANQSLESTWDLSLHSPRRKMIE